MKVIKIREFAGKIFSAFDSPFLDGFVKHYDLEKIEIHDDGRVILSGIIHVNAFSDHPGDVKIETQSSFSFTLTISPDGETELKLPAEIEVETTITRTKTHKREDIPGG